MLFCLVSYISGSVPIALKLLKRETNIETIAELTELTITEINQLKELLD
ncbi:hypothetical protein [Lysinibacillus sphaericus]|uniref:Uncharacterized protein n=2 Tax=Lysinibacillus sphaericus TaxID=1421 RepID=A0AAJ4ZTN7_LYSSH|nr:hypothetical protein [Lysinibacillus sphaericus]MED4543929.1 hypothetical protein [Lysinibacillus sphaericus]SUV16378.1 Uncharacterised protein [Lysinibacillus sphaericus]